MNAGVILAAGDSTRMGFPKQLAEFKNMPLLTYHFIDTFPVIEDQPKTSP